MLTVLTTLCAAAAAGEAAAVPVRGPGAVPVRVPEADTPRPYAFSEDAGTVAGADGTTEAVRLEAGSEYRSAIKKDGKLYYRLDLDGTSNAYVSATAVPRAGTEVTSADGIKVSVQNADGSTCSSEAAHIGPTQSPHPVAAWASREIGHNTYACQEAGTYYLVVERSSTPSSPSGTWDLELDYVSEPPLRTGGSTTAPETWDSASPEVLQGDATSRAGGAGFGEAAALGQGVWKAGIEPGQTLFYKVPVDWGQQLYTTAELGGSGSGNGYVGTALAMALYNPVRGHVDDVGSGYDGSQRAASLPALPPVDYGNRFSINGRTSGMRFAGAYYLVVHLSERVAEKFGEGPFGLTLRVRVSGDAEDGPAYAGGTEPRGAFEVTAEERAEAEQGATGDTARAPAGGAAGSAGDGGGGTGGSDEATGQGDPAMKVVAVAGIGSGTVLVLTLWVWRAVARRRVRSVRTTAGH
ncbi:hypothetical protein ACFV6E_04975 [Streptomyces sp. NPDC059785]|uniref:hypothetical protein n=1 Tax=Streptomyces sp. NPDC059785 TaxID=3346945 RepID=UPI00365AD97C